MENREEMERTLRRGAEILSEHPELMGKDMDTALRDLDDGTEGMLHDRWGAVAHLVLVELTECDIVSLVPALAKQKDRGFLCTYVGYLLLTKHNVNLIALLVESENQGLFDSILPYVSENLQFAPHFSEEDLRSLLTVLNRHLNSRLFWTTLESCAEQVTALGVQSVAVACLGELTGEAECAFLRSIAQQWYQADREQVMETVEMLLSHASTWSRRAGFALIEYSLRVCDTDFLQQYPKVEEILREEPSLRPTAIPMLVSFLQNYEDTEQNRETYHRVLSELQKIPDASLEERRSFLQAIEWNKDIKPVIEALFQSIISRSFSKDAAVLTSVDHYLYFRAKRPDADWNEIFQTMLAAFAAGGFAQDFMGFFDSMQGLTYDIARQAPVQGTAFALWKILTGNVEAFYFGLGLLVEAGNIPKLAQERDTLVLAFPDIRGDEQLISIMKGILYFTHDSNRICTTAFQLLLLAEEPAESFLAFLLQEVYAQYSSTMFDLAESFQKNGTTLQIRLADMVIEENRCAVKQWEAVRKIRDLAPSAERQRVFLEAQAELMRRAEANSRPSVFHTLFPSRMLKFGARIGWVMQKRDGQLAYNASTPVQISHQMELPAGYVNDPVEYGMKRDAYLKEVRTRAIDHQGLSTVPARKG